MKYFCVIQFIIELNIPVLYSRGPVAFVIHIILNLAFVLLQFVAIGHFFKT